MANQREVRCRCGRQMWVRSEIRAVQCSNCNTVTQLNSLVDTAQVHGFQQPRRKQQQPQMPSPPQYHEQPPPMMMTQPPSPRQQRKYHDEQEPQMMIQQPPQHHKYHEQLQETMMTQLPPRRQYHDEQEPEMMTKPSPQHQKYQYPEQQPQMMIPKRQYPKPQMMTQPPPKYHYPEMMVQTPPQRQYPKQQQQQQMMIKPSSQYPQHQPETMVQPPPQHQYPKQQMMTKPPPEQYPKQQMMTKPPPDHQYPEQEQEQETMVQQPQHQYPKQQMMTKPPPQYQYPEQQQQHPETMVQPPPQHQYPKQQMMTKPPPQYQYPEQQQQHEMMVQPPQHQYPKEQMMTKPSPRYQYPEQEEMMVQPPPQHQYPKQQMMTKPSPQYQYPEQKQEMIAKQSPPRQLEPLPSAFGKKRAVLCGVNYKGKSYSLKGCINDAKSMRSLLIQQLGFPIDSILMLTEDEADPQRLPTKRNIRNAMRWLVEGNRARDSLVFHFSGHGSQQKDYNEDENDGQDETICPLDHETEGKIIDDEINRALVRPLVHGAKLHAIIDACNSGTVFDLPFICRMERNGYYEWEDQRSVLAYKGTDGGSVFCFSACDDDESSSYAPVFTGKNAGTMTYSFIKAVKTAGPAPTYGHLLNLMCSAVREAQSRLTFDGTDTSSEPLLTSSEEFDLYKKKFLL